MRMSLICFSQHYSCINFDLPRHVVTVINLVIKFFCVSLSYQIEVFRDRLLTRPISIIYVAARQFANILTGLQMSLQLAMLMWFLYPVVVIYLLVYALLYDYISSSCQINHHLLRLLEKVIYLKLCCGKTFFSNVRYFSRRVIYLEEVHKLRLISVRIVGLEAKI